MGFDFKAFTNGLKTLSSVHSVHDVHVWSISTGKIAFSAHIRAANHHKALKQVTAYARKYGIYHSTLQVEIEDPAHQKTIPCLNNIHK